MPPSRMARTREQRDEAQPQPELKSARLGTRVTGRQKQLLQRAADLTGRSLSDFVISSALLRAQETIRHFEVLELSERDARAFFDTLENPPKLNEKLYEAMRWQRANVEMR